jgi:Tol biopolymer transport system component
MDKPIPPLPNGPNEGRLDSWKKIAVYLKRDITTVQRIAFSVRQRSQTLLYAMESDGSRAHIVSDSLELRGAPAWAPDCRSIISAADQNGVPHLFRIPLEGNTPTPFIDTYSVDPTWSPDGQFVIYSGPDIGTKFAVKAATAEAILERAQARSDVVVIDRPAA